MLMVQKHVLRYFEKIYEIREGVLHKMEYFYNMITEFY